MRKTIVLLALMGSMPALGAGTALAAQRQGNDRDNTLVGTGKAIS